LGIYDVPAKHLIEEAAGKLKTEITEPEFVGYVKTGMHKERAPQREDWFYVRMGSILYSKVNDKKYWELDWVTDDLKDGKYLVQA